MIQIVIHTLPQEIDQLEQLLIRLKYNSIYLSNNESILVDVVLNCNLIEWDSSLIPKSFFINKFKQLEQLTKTWANTKFEINEDGTIQGCVSHRRQSIRQSQADALLILDTDIFFNDTLLYFINHAIDTLKNTDEYFILTPQTTPMWDDSWNLIVNQSFNDNIHFQKRDPYKYLQNLGEVTVRPINGFKFGGGWATVISAPLAKKINVPDSLGHYGLEDTFIMYCSYILKEQGINVTQYILENQIIVEDHLYRFNPYKDYLTIINKQEEFKKIAHENFQNELNKFGNSLND